MQLQQCVHLAHTGVSSGRFTENGNEISDKLLIQYTKKYIIFAHGKQSIYYQEVLSVI